MVVGVKEPSDVSFDNTADLMLGGRRFENQDVFGDAERPKVRTVFIDEDVRAAFPGDSLPETGRVRWQGDMYDARLSFRTRQGGGAIPVYEFRVESGLP